MKKRIIAATLLATSLTLFPIMATATETDYSYLEDMSVKELKALDAAIHEILGNDTANEEEPKELTGIEKGAIIAVDYLKSILKSPASLKIEEIYAVEMPNEIYAYKLMSKMDNTDYTFYVESGEDEIFSMYELNIEMTGLEMTNNTIKDIYSKYVTSGKEVKISTDILY